MFVAISGLWHLVPHQILHRTRGFLTNRRVSDPHLAKYEPIARKFFATTLSCDFVAGTVCPDFLAYEGHARKILFKLLLQ